MSNLCNHRMTVHSFCSGKPIKRKQYQMCPDCGEFHSPDEDNGTVGQDEYNEICPDCGVRHNPYQHTPSAQVRFTIYSVIFSSFFSYLLSRYQI